MFEGAAVAGMTWVAGYFATMWLASGTSSASGYALLCAWWLTAYTSSRVNVPLISVVPLYGAYLILFMATYIRGSSAFYHDMDAIALHTAAGIGAVQGLLVISPILFDAVVRQVARRSTQSTLP